MQHNGTTGHIIGDIMILFAGWGLPPLLNLTLADLSGLSDIITPIAQVGTSIFVLITAIIRFRNRKKD